MKKLIAAITALALLLAALVPALAEADAHTLEGYVTEVMEDGFVIEDKDMGEVMLNVDATTAYDGILADSPLTAGLYVFVAYDGKLTKSIPPQAHADKVGCYVLNGVAGDFMPEGVMLTGDETFGDVLVRFDSTLAHVYPDVPMTVYYNGVMAMSLPGQVNAAAIIVPTLEGVVSELNEDGDGFTLETDTGDSVLVSVDGGTVVGRLLGTDSETEADDSEDGVIDAEAQTDVEAADVEDGIDDAEAQTDAEAVDTENGVDDTDAEAADSLANSDWVIDTDAATRVGYELLTLDSLSIGDRVTVYYNGEDADELEDEANAEDADIAESADAGESADIDVDADAGESADIVEGEDITESSDAGEVEAAEDAEANEAANSADSVSGATPEGAKHIIALEVLVIRD